MESRVSNLETKLDDFKTSHSSRSLLSVVDLHERAMESCVKNAETTLADLQKEIKSNNELILQMLQSLSARDGVGSSRGNNSSKGMHTDSKIREGLNPNLGPNFGRPHSCCTSIPPFIKMASHIFVLKSDEIVLKLQAFHNKKIQAQEKVDEFLSQYCPKYKLKSPFCLRPTLKKVKRVRDYATYHEDGSARFHFSSKFQESFGLFRSALAKKNEKVFDLLGKQVDDYVESPPFLNYDCKIGTAKKLVSGLLISELLEKIDDLPSFRFILEIMVGFQLFVSVGTISGVQSLKNLDKEALKKFGFMGFDHCFTHDFTGSYALQVFDERSHSAHCDFQLGYHMPITDTRSTLCGLLTLNVQNKDAHISKFLICNGKFMKNHTIVHLKFGFHELICDKGGTISHRLFNSKSKNKDCVMGSDCSKVVKCEVIFDSSMVIHGEYGGNLGLHHLEAYKNKNQKKERKFTISTFETGWCVVLDRECCKGIRDKGESSKFRKQTLEMICMHCLNIQPVGPICSTPSYNGLSIANYYCNSCKLFDVGRSIYHCPFCNLCPVGKGLSIDYFHYMKCNCYLSISMPQS